MYIIDKSLEYLLFNFSAFSGFQQGTIFLGVGNLVVSHLKGTNLDEFTNLGVLRDGFIVPVGLRAVK